MRKEPVRPLLADGGGIAVNLTKGETPVSEPSGALDTESGRC